MFDQTFLQQIADNWLLVSMFTLFVGAVLWAFRPGSRRIHQETSSIPFRNDDYPAPQRAGRSSKDEELQP